MPIDYETEVKNTDCMGRVKVGSVRCCLRDSGKKFYGSKSMIKSSVISGIYGIFCADSKTRSNTECMVRKKVAQKGFWGSMKKCYGSSPC